MGDTVICSVGSQVQSKLREYFIEEHTYTAGINHQDLFSVGFLIRESLIHTF